MGTQISLILTLYLAFALPAALLFRVNKVQGCLGILGQATLILWPIATVVCLLKINYSDLRIWDKEDDED